MSPENKEISILDNNWFHFRTCHRLKQMQSLGAKHPLEYVAILASSQIKSIQTFRDNLVFPLSLPSCKFCITLNF